ncbi:MAG: O-antigen ligase family protein [Christensenellales bacterium]
MIKKNKKNGHAFLIYFWGFPMIQFPILLLPQLSTWIVFALLLFSCLYWLYEIYEADLNKFTLQVVAIVIILAYFLFNFIFRYNHITFDYFVYFIMYGLLSILFSMTIDDYYAFIKQNSICSLLVFLAYVSIPIIGYDKLGMGNYMDFGFGVALPVYMSLYIGRHVIKEKKLIFFELICLIELVLYANRSCFLSVIFIWIMYFLIFKKKRIKDYVFMFAIIVGLAIIINNFKDIVLWINKEVFVKYEIEFRFWQKIRYFAISSDWNRLFSGRIEIWQNVIEMISQRPWTGWGLGYFESVYGHGYYAHNIVLEIAVEIGIIGATIIGVLFLYMTVTAFRKADRVSAMALLLFLCLTIPKLLLSNIHYKDIAFWFFLSMIIKFSQSRGVKNECIDNKQILYATNSHCGSKAN